jgi:hypothetical protein
VGAHQSIHTQSCTPFAAVRLVPACWRRSIRYTLRCMVSWNQCFGRPFCTDIHVRICTELLSYPRLQKYL